MSHSNGSAPHHPQHPHCSLCSPGWIFLVLPSLLLELGAASASSIPRHQGIQCCSQPPPREPCSLVLSPGAERAEHAGAICTRLVTCPALSLLVRANYLVHSNYFFGSCFEESTCQELPAAPPAGASCVIVWLRIGQDSICLAQRATERENFIS